MGSTDNDSSCNPLFCSLPLVQNLERAANQQKAEVGHLTEQLVRLKQQASADRDALKRATRAQKQRAERSEGTAGHLSVQLLDVVGLCHINLYSLDLLVRVTLDTGMSHFYNYC